MERVAPRQVAYENQLPLAIESKSQRRKFFPEGATTYGPNGNTRGHPNIIRIPINADSLLDCQHSYLQFTINNLDGGGRTMGLDVGIPWLKRIRIESAGTTLEDIDNYNKLFGSVLFPSQATVGAVNEYSLAGMGVGTNTALTNLAAGGGGAALGQIADDASANAGAAHTTEAELQGAIDGLRDRIIAAFNTRTTASIAGASHDANDTLANGASKTFNICLHTGLLNLEKYLPLVMMNAGLILELEIDNRNSVGVNSGGAGAPCDFSISDVAYYAHLIDLQRDFYDRLRMVMEGSGGVLQLTGTTFRTYQSNFAAGAATTYNMSIPARMKSIKSIFFTHTRNDRRYAADYYGIGGCLANGVSEFQFRVGSVVYPAQAVKASETNPSEAYQELRKAFGSLGSLAHGGVLLNANSYYNDADIDHAQAGNLYRFTPYGLDFESFPKTTLENGINSADRSLPITLEMKRVGGVNADMDVDAFVMCDAVWYVNLDGSVSVSV